MPLRMLVLATQISIQSNYRRRVHCVKGEIKLSGQICETSGLYWSSGCGHASCIDIDEGATFPQCESCHRVVKWVPQKPPVSEGVQNIKRIVPPC